MQNKLNQHERVVDFEVEQISECDFNVTEITDVELMKVKQDSNDGKTEEEPQVGS